MPDADFRPIRPFMIDNGELDGYSEAESFVLGYELALIDEAVKLPDGFSRPVHAANRERIEHGCKSREFTLNFMAEDQSEAWMWLEVMPVTHG